MNGKRMRLGGFNVISRHRSLPALRFIETRGISRAWARCFFSVVWAAGSIICLPVAGCVNINLGQGQQGTPQTRQSSSPGAFVVEGTIVEGGFVRPCLVFEAENGIEYHLVRGNGVSEAIFEELTALGAGSALEVVLRRDLDERCQANDVLQVLEVISVLDINPS